MNQINLLPWREQVRQQLKVKFFAWLIVFALLGVFAIILFHIYYARILHTANARKNFLQTSLNQEQSVLFSLNKKLKDQAALKAKLDFIILLHQNNNQVVRLFNDLARLVPEGVSLTKLVRKQNKLIIYGKSQSNLQVTQFMEKMSQSLNFRQPELTNITGKESKTEEDKNFEITVQLM